MPATHAQWSVDQLHCVNVPPSWQSALVEH